MNRKSFFKKLGIGAVALPVAACSDTKKSKTLEDLKSEKVPPPVPAEPRKASDSPQADEGIITGPDGNILWVNDSSWRIKSEIKDADILLSRDGRMLSIDELIDERVLDLLQEIKDKGVV